MTFFRKQGILICLFLILAIIAVVPVSAVMASETTAGPAGAQVPAAQPVAAASSKPMVSATVSSAEPAVGDPVTISGVATGGNLSAGVQIWVFAGNYIDVSTVPVNTDGTFTKTYPTTGLPPATYYVFVQSPGNDGKFGLTLEKSGRFSGQIVDAKDGSLLVNMTGTGSVQDSAAAVALVEALNKRGGDDVYTKTTFQLVTPTPAAPPATVTTVPPATTAKSPLSPLILLAGLGVCGAALVLARK